MKFMMLMLTMLSFSAIAKGEKIEIYRWEDSLSLSGKFEINQDLGRAWVNVTESTSFGEEGYSNSFRMKVSGLRYDKELMSIIFERDGRIVECAKVRIGRVFKNEFIKESDCTFEATTKKVKRDDGFEVKTYDVSTLYLVIK
jgi:hypothetical protein